MSDSMITRCPKCSTAFRVGTDVLSMAKGKVRCGQCFHIFEAKPIAQPANVATTQPTTTASTRATSTASTSPTQPQANTTRQQAPIFTVADDDPINPEWLHTLFTDEDLSPIDKLDDQANLNGHSKRAIMEDLSQTEDDSDDYSSPTEEPAPWERELAELDAQLSSSATQPVQEATPHNTDFPITQSKHNQDAAQLVNKTNKLAQPLSENQDWHTATTPSLSLQATTSYDALDAPEPDYMLALQSLAQTTAHSANEPLAQNSANLQQIAAQERLAPLMGMDEPTSTQSTQTRTWLWVLACLVASLILFYQITTHFFDIGSRSATFRPFYKAWCTYTSCSLPSFENTSMVNIQHVRIQSHPTRNNVLLVNAIMTNTSDFSQPMPTIALEFFDLNGAPVAARLFAPKNFLHKDFLDITYMPPNTPIHLVIPIQDPGAQAVTHQLKVYPSGTQSY